MNPLENKTPTTLDPENFSFPEFEENEGAKFFTNQIEYWKKRCELAEEVLKHFGYSENAMAEELQARKEWIEFRRSAKAGIEPDEKPIKEKLIYEKAQENHFSMIDCVRYYFPDITNKDADFIIWEKTCFPFNDETVFNQLYELYLNDNK